MFDLYFIPSADVYHPVVKSHALLFKGEVYQLSVVTDTMQTAGLDAVDGKLCRGLAAAWRYQESLAWPEGKTVDMPDDGPSREG